MATKKKTFLVTTKTQEIIAIHKNPATLLKYCEQCQEKVEMMTLDATTFQTGKSTRELFYLIESELLHSIETERGHLLVCSHSLRNLDKQKLIENK